MMKSGTLRHTVIIQSPAGASNTAGQRVTEWTDVLCTKAAIDPLSVREQFMAAQEHASATHRLRVHYRRSISAMDGSWRVKQGDRIFVLIGLPINVDEHNREIDILCVEGLRDE